MKEIIFDSEFVVKSFGKYALGSSKNARGKKKEREREREREREGERERDRER